MIDLFDIAPDFEFYSSEYHGKMEQDTFDGVLSDAVAEVEFYIWPKADTEANEKRIKMAICAVADVIGCPEKRRTSYTAGEVREEFSGAGYSLSAEAAVRRYLANTGILKKGQWL